MILRTIISFASASFMLTSGFSAEPGSRETAPASVLDPPLRVDLETYYIFNQRAELKGTVAITDAKRIAKFLPVQGGDAALLLEVVNLSGKDDRWQTTLVLAADSPSKKLFFTIPISQVGKGYNRVWVSLKSADKNESRPESPAHYAYRSLRPVVDFAVLEKKPSRPGSPFDGDVRKRYLDFVETTVSKLIREQSCRLGGADDGVPFITVTGKVRRARRSIGVRLGNTYQSVLVGGQAPEFFEPFRLDLEAWPILDLLSECTGDPKYARMVADMAESFAAHGFDERSGLGYLGEETAFDVIRRKPISNRELNSPTFKPGNTGNDPDLPLDRLWKHAPHETARMFRSAFYGLITDQARMDYNRFCHYNFDDSIKEPAMKQQGHYLGFSSAGSRLIQWWGSAFAETGDEDFLHWARKMADKWKAVQQPESGLVPYYFGGNRSGGSDMPPAPFAGIRDGSTCALALAKAAREFDRRPEGRALADQISGMGIRLARGTAQFCYDEETGRFRDFVNLDGTPRSSTTSRYVFRTQREKDEAVKHDPKMREVPVVGGQSFYLAGPYSRYSTGTVLPLQLATVARLTNDSDLLARTALFAERIMNEFEQVTAAFTAEGKWTFYATGHYIKTMLQLYEATRDGRYLQRARTLADRELDHLDEIVYPEWWRTRERNAFLEGLLRLHLVLERESR